MLRYLDFERSEGADDSVTLEAMASVWPAQSAEVESEIQQVLDWLRAQWPWAEGPLEEGGGWCHDLSQQADGDSGRTLWILSVTIGVNFYVDFCQRWDVPV